MNSTVYDAFRCLNLLSTATRPLGIREMGRELGLDSAKVTRLIQTLLTLDMVQRDANRKYSLGIGIHRLSAHAIHNSAFYNAVMDLLEESGNHAISISPTLFSESSAQQSGQKHVAQSEILPPDAGVQPSGCKHRRLCYSTAICCGLWQELSCMTSF